MEDQNIIMSEKDFYEHTCTTTTGESKVYTHTHTSSFKFSWNICESQSYLIFYVPTSMSWHKE